MNLGRVIGTVWASRKDPGLENRKLLIVRNIGLDGKALSSFDVAVDSVQAGVGDLVLVTKGSSARQTEATQNRPVDAVIMAVVEGYDAQPLEALEAANAARSADLAREISGLRED